jgi:hypothetical protein
VLNLLVMSPVTRHELPIDRPQSQTESSPQLQSEYKIGRPVAARASPIALYLYDNSEKLYRFWKHLPRRTLRWTAVLTLVVTVIVLEIVDSPAGECLCVNGFLAETGCISCALFRSEGHPPVKDVHIQWQYQH